jgi:hypothetical protein
MNKREKEKEAAEKKAASVPPTAASAKALAENKYLKKVSCASFSPAATHTPALTR